MGALEREELEWLLTSGVLGRSSNVAKVLRYICEESAAGRADLIKEYSIAVEALGRRPDFDPQSDTIVRVTVHTLRKRLQEIYQREGTRRSIRIVIPPGHYAVLFLPQRHFTEDLSPGPVVFEEPNRHVDRSSRDHAVAAPQAVDDSLRRRFSGWWVPAGFLVLGCAFWIVYSKRMKTGAAFTPAPAVALSTPLPLLRTLMGSARLRYTDHSGQVWTRNQYCKGGDDVSVPNARISGTEDTYLYQGGVRGIVHCVFPVKRGFYELHFHFAEPSDLEAAQRPAQISINAGPAIGVDVVDEAGGDQIATVKVITGVVPENDGAIHLDFTSEVSPLNAIEILPAPSATLLPVRIVAASGSWVDEDKHIWLSDRYFSGGRRGLRPDPDASANLGLYSSDRIGRFHYTIPVTPLAHYRIRLYFREPWFGRASGANGGRGSRVFDVDCNGVVLLKNFDIFAEAGSAPVVKTFDHVQATSRGTIELYFMPVTNYPLVNAIEVVPSE
jgi:hypothetical protein